jgi:hypothetical protein
MKDARELLAEKELELARVKKDLEALRIVAPLLRDEEDCVREAAERKQTSTVMPSLVQAEAVLDSPHAFSSRSSRWRDAAKRLFPVRRHSSAQ